MEHTLNSLTFEDFESNDKIFLDTITTLRDLRKNIEINKPTTRVTHTDIQIRLESHKPLEQPSDKLVIIKARKSGIKHFSDLYHDIGIRALYYSFTPKKETNMSQDLIQAIRVISGTEQKDELSRFEQMPANIKEAMTRKMATRQQEASEKIADQLITLLDAAASHKIRHLQLSRTLRAQMNVAIANVKRFHAAEQLANSGNFAPLVLVVHGTSGFSIDEIKKIEQDLEDQIKKDSAEPKTTSAPRKRNA